MDELLEPTVTVKVIGHQWYWSYEYSDFKPLLNETIKFDSYMIPDTELKLGDLRLLKTDCPLILPKETNIRFLITATDVLHSWSVPSFGIKMDAVPGRLNQTSAYIMEGGRFYGQCSELCGVNHGFMPTEICVVEPIDYYNWVYLKI
jgi:cytochrome c oxidase subunit 2